MLTPAERTMKSLRWEVPDKAAFTIYDNHLPRCTEERELRNRGLCLVKRAPSYKVVYPNVKTVESHYRDEQGRDIIRLSYETPCGTISTCREPAGFTSWTHEYFFKSPDDYKAMLFMVKDSVIEPNYAAAAKLVEDCGGDFVVRDGMPLEPLQCFISSSWMSMEDFCMEWMDNRDEILKLYEAQVEVARKVYPVVADGPLEFANYGGNVVPQVVSEQMFREYYTPNYNEAAEVLHKKGKLIGTHLDADNTTLMDAVAETHLDYIEAYDPGMSPSVKAAREKWPGKALWLNWPSAWHLRPVDEVKAGTMQLIEEAGGLAGFIIGITEDVPEERWRQNYAAIMDGIDEAAK